MLPTSGQPAHRTHRTARSGQVPTRSRGRHTQYGVHTEVHRIASHGRSCCDGPGAGVPLLFLCLARASWAQSHSHSPHTAKLPTTFLCGSWCMKRSPAVNLPSGPRRTR